MRREGQSQNAVYLPGDSGQEKERATTIPKMGGVINTLNSKELWTGGKPTLEWTGLELASKKNAQATQIRSKTTKAAASMNKRLKGM